MEHHEPEQSGGISRFHNSRTHFESDDRFSNASNAVRFAPLLVIGAGLFLSGALGAQTVGAKAASEISKRAQAALAANDSARAESELKELLRLQPDNANAYANLGVLALSRSDYKAAAEFFQNATRLEPQLWSARALLGLCKIRTGERAAGEKLIDESLPHVDAAVVRKQTGLALVDSYAASGQLAKAINTIESLKRGHPADADILYTAYRTYSELAAHALSALAHAAPDSVRMHEVMAQNLMSQENASGAIAEYRKALALDSRVPGLHFELGQAIRSASNTAAARKEAEQEFRAELEINPSDANALYEIGELVFEGGGFDDAASHFRRAIDLRPAFAEARIALGKALAAEGKPAEALEQYREVIRLEPDNDVVHYRLAQAYKKLGRDAEARQELAHYSELKAIRERIGVIVSQAERRAVREQNIDSPQ